MADNWAFPVQQTLLHVHVPHTRIHRYSIPKHIFLQLQRQLSDVVKLSRPECLRNVRGILSNLGVCSCVGESTGELCRVKSVSTQSSHSSLYRNTAALWPGARFIVYDSAQTSVPYAVLMVLRHSVLSVFECKWGERDLKLPGGDLLSALTDPVKSNADVLHLMHPFLCKTPLNATDSDAGSDTETVCLEDSVVVHIPEIHDGAREHPRSAAKLRLSATGMRCARDALRERGALYTDPNMNTIVLAQDAEYTLNMWLHSGVFKLQLHDTERLLAANAATDLPLVTVSHRFHSMDNFVEETQLLHCPSSGKQCKRSLPFRVTGMVAAAQTLLRRNVTAVPLRSMGSNRVASVYQDMHPVDITRVFHAMRLVSDNPQIANYLNRLRATNSPKRAIVTCVSGAVLTVPKTEDTRVDVRLYHSSALRYAIAHQNIAVTGFLRGKCGLDIREISTALYSGIAFCHACAYDAWPVLQNDTGDTVHLINGTDFTKSEIDAVTKLVIYETTNATKSLRDKVGSLIERTGVSPERWSRLRHNFRVGVNGEFHPILSIECHATDSGVVFFRRVKDPHAGRATFIGAAYVPPGHRASFTDSSHTHRPLHTSPRVGVSENLCLTVAELAVQTASSKRAILRNATESLFHLNSICIQNRSTRLGNRETHAMLRKAWLHTYMLRIARACGGVNNTDYYGLYAHISNLAAMPLDAAAYWGTVPYA
jgi:hypothetical protein